MVQQLFLSLARGTCGAYWQGQSRFLNPWSKPHPSSQGPLPHLAQCETIQYKSCNLFSIQRSGRQPDFPSDGVFVCASIHVAVIMPKLVPLGPESPCQRAPANTGFSVMWNQNTVLPPSDCYSTGMVVAESPRMSREFDTLFMMMS